MYGLSCFINVTIHPNIFGDVNGEYMDAGYVVHLNEKSRTVFLLFSFTYICSFIRIPDRTVSHWCRYQT